MENTKNKFENIVKYVYETGYLKHLKRAGWSMLGIPAPESVAEHTFRTAILGYMLASLEGADPQKTATICLFHDIPEARIGDLHRVARRYIDAKEGEAEAFAEQMQRLPEEAAKHVTVLFRDYEEGLSQEGVLAKDADLLECLVQAREYQVQGYAGVSDWIEGCYKGLRSASAKQLADVFLQVDPQEWWKGLKQ